jgi:hypothetical protein
MRRVPTTTTTMIIIKVLAEDDEDEVDDEDEEDDCENEIFIADALNLSKSIDPKPVTGSHPDVA